MKIQRFRLWHLTAVRLAVCLFILFGERVAAVHVAQGVFNCALDGESSELALPSGHQQLSVRGDLGFEIQDSKVTILELDFATSPVPFRGQTTALVFELDPSSPAAAKVSPFISSVWVPASLLFAAGSATPPIPIEAVLQINFYPELTGVLSGYLPGNEPRRGPGFVIPVSCALVPMDDMDLGNLGGETRAYDINNAGEVVGETTRSRDLLVRAWQKPRFGPQVKIPAIPLDAAAHAFSINNAGEIAGHTNRAFFAANGVITDIGTLPGHTASSAFGINDSGIVVGQSLDFAGVGSAFRWTGSTPEALGSLGGPSSAALSVADNGVIVGWAELRAARPGLPAPRRAFVYNDHAGLRNLNDLIDAESGWTLEVATDTNGTHIVGNGRHGDLRRAFRFREGEVLDLGTLPGGGSSFAYGVNNLGHVVGAAVADPADATSTRAVLYTDAGGLVDLQSLVDPGLGWDLREARAINDSGEIVGWGLKGGAVRAFRLTLGATASILDLEPPTLIKGGTSAVSLDTSGVSVFANGINGHLMENNGEAGWTDHGTPAGTIVNSSPAAISYVARCGTQVHVFVAGLDGRLYERRRNCGAWEWIDRGIPPVAPAFPYLAPSTIVASDASAVTWEDHSGKRRINVFVLSSANRLAELATSDGFVWHWLDRGIPVPNSPSYPQPNNQLGGSPPYAFVGHVDNLGKQRTFVYVVMKGRYNNLIQAMGHTLTDADFAGWSWKDHGHATIALAPGLTLKAPMGSAPVGFAFTDHRRPPDGTGGRTIEARIYSTTRDGSGLMELVLSGELPDRQEGGWVLHTIPSGSAYALSRRERPGLAVWGNLSSLGENDLNFQMFLTAETKLNPGDSHPEFGKEVVTFHRENVFDVFPLESVWGHPDYPHDVSLDPLYRGTGRIVGAPSVASRPTPFGDRELRMFAVRANGTLMDYRVQRDGSELEGGTWNMAHGPYGALVENSADARARGCNDWFFAASLFPSWVPVQQKPKGGKLIGVWDLPMTIEGTVVRSRISSIDTPLNHTLHDDSIYQGNTVPWRPIVSHDWNVLVALDPPYQHLLADSNIADNGLMEIEWEQREQQLPVAALPGVGDRVKVRGRWIFDCGHPSPKTEIHPASSIVSLRSEPFVPREFFLTDSGRARPDIVSANQAVLTMSSLGGRTDFRGTRQNCELHLPEGFELDLGTVFGLWYAYKVDDDFPLTLANSDNACYDHYPPPTRPDIKPGPVEFELLLPPKPDPSAVPSLHREIAGENPPEAVVELLTNPDRYVIHVDGYVPPVWPGPPAAPAFYFAPVLKFRAYWRDGGVGLPVPSASARYLEVCSGIRADRAKVFNRDIGGVFSLPDGVGEWIYYHSANGHYTRVEPRKGGEDCCSAEGSVCPSILTCDTQLLDAGACQKVGVESGQMLRIGGGGFECDMSCNEWPDRGDDALVDAADDKIGTIDLGFDIGSDFGVKPGDYAACSQPSLGLNDATSHITSCDYTMFFSIRDVY